MGCDLPNFTEPGEGQGCRETPFTPGTRTLPAQPLAAPPPAPKLFPHLQQSGILTNISKKEVLKLYSTISFSKFF